jgi:hypothetical protein
VCILCSSQCVSSIVIIFHHTCPLSIRIILTPSSCLCFRLLYSQPVSSIIIIFHHLSSHACPLLDSHTALLACVVNSLFIIVGKFHYHNISSYLSCLFLYFSSVRVNSPSLLFDHHSLPETSHHQKIVESLKRVRQEWRVKW